MRRNMGAFRETKQVRGHPPFFPKSDKDNEGRRSANKRKKEEIIIPSLYHLLMVSYGWTIDYINEHVSLAQAKYLLEEINKKPPTAVLGFVLGQDKKSDDVLLGQINKLGDKVKYDRWFNKESVKKVTRKRDGKRLK